MFFFRKPTPPLTKITAPDAASICTKFQPQPAAKSLLEPGQTPAEYLDVLEENQQSLDSVNLLAHGMPERESVWWACQSSQQVAPKLNVADANALAAAEQWVKTPTPETRAAAGLAAGKTDFTGPGAWAAQAAAWSQASAPAVASAAPAAGGPVGLTAPAVSGSVLLASGLAQGPAMPLTPAAPAAPVAPKPGALPVLPAAPKLAAPAPVPTPTVPPLDSAKLSKNLKPFVDLGKDVASGKNSWA